MGKTSMKNNLKLLAISLLLTASDFSWSADRDRENNFSGHRNMSERELNNFRQNNREVVARMDYMFAYIKSNYPKSQFANLSEAEERELLYGASGPIFGRHGNGTRTMAVLRTKVSRTSCDHYVGYGSGQIF